MIRTCDPLIRSQINPVSLCMCDSIGIHVAVLLVCIAQRFAVDAQVTHTCREFDLLL